MSVIRKVKAVERLYALLDSEISSFKNASGLHCVAGCGKCCTKSDIEASPLEFLPWAFHTFASGKAEDTLEALQVRQNSICHLYQPLSVVDQVSGKCGDYVYRGLICRLFGYGASKDKMGQLRLATCRIIKEGQQEFYEKTREAINSGMYVPVFSEYYMRLSRIDMRLGMKMLPVNKAMQVALEEVLHHYAYRPFPKKYKRAS